MSGMLVLDIHQDYFRGRIISSLRNINSMVLYYSSNYVVLIIFDLTLTLVLS